MSVIKQFSRINCQQSSDYVVCKLPCRQHYTTFLVPACGLPYLLVTECLACNVVCKLPGLLWSMLNLFRNDKRKRSPLSLFNRFSCRNETASTFCKNTECTCCVHSDNILLLKDESEVHIFLSFYCCFAFSSSFLLSLSMFVCK
jgi:hypothetical protein